MKIDKRPNFVRVDMTHKEYEAFVEILKLRETHLKDYRGGK